jgi:hypothetical protein
MSKILTIFPEHLHAANAFSRGNEMNGGAGGGEEIDIGREEGRLRQIGN